MYVDDQLDEIVETDEFIEKEKEKDIHRKRRIIEQQLKEEKSNNKNKKSDKSKNRKRSMRYGYFDDFDN
ncbi:MAG: hypothetical protein K0R54_104 [Clostridiaceae bacterium]|jgi:hypothetical protein|nr:hypothetical protein [Clostridiaceae bacterium]